MARGGRLTSLVANLVSGGQSDDVGKRKRERERQLLDRGGVDVAISPNSIWISGGRKE